MLEKLIELLPALSMNLNISKIYISRDQYEKFKSECKYEQAPKINGAFIAGIGVHDLPYLPEGHVLFMDDKERLLALLSPDGLRIMKEPIETKIKFEMKQFNFTNGE